MKRSTKRLLGLLGALVIASSAAAAVLYVFKDSLVYYQTPTDVAEGKLEVGKVYRLGGMVANIKNLENLDGITSFMLTDFNNSQEVHTTASLPSLFKENSGAVAQGSLAANGIFIATRILAKHDENYRPPKSPNAEE